MKILTVAWNIVNYENNQFSVPNNGYSVMVHNICEYIGRKIESYLLQGWPTVPNCIFEHINVIANAVSKPEEMTSVNVADWQQKLLAQFEATIKENRYDFVFIHGAGEFCLNCVETCMKKKVPFAVVFHGEAFRQAQFVKKEIVDIEKKMVSIPDINIITVSHGNKKGFLEDYPFLKSEQVSVIVNASPNNVVHGKLNKTIPFDLSNKKILICSGTLHPNKNQLQLIRAFALLPESYRNNVLLILVGKNSSRFNYLELINNEIAKLKLDEFVKYLGSFLPASMAEIYERAEGMVSPSLHEGLSCSVLEMLQFGKPVVMFADNETASDVNSPDATILVQNRTDQALADAIVEWYNRDWDKRKIIEYASFFSLERLADEYIEYAQKSI